MHIISGELDEILNGKDLELDHQRIEYGSTNITLAWKIIPTNTTCTNSRVLSYDQCQPDNPNVNMTTEDMITILPSTEFCTVAGELVDFDISSFSDQQQEKCPRLLTTVRFNGNVISGIANLNVQ